MSLYTIYYLESDLFNITNIIHMTISVSRIINMLHVVLRIMFKIIAFFTISLFTQLYVRVVILLICGKHLYDCII